MRVRKNPPSLGGGVVKEGDYRLSSIVELDVSNEENMPEFTIFVLSSVTLLQSSLFLALVFVLFLKAKREESLWLEEDKEYY